jgi:SAM-dependent methyltransferase
MSASDTTFDPRAFKATTRRQWDDAAEAWNRWGEFLETWLGPATARMLDLAAIEGGSAVLDVAAGAGGQTLAAAERAGADGRVLATDISPGILEFAAANARAAGRDNVETKVLDGEDIDLEPGTFDAAISRLGLIYFPDREASVRGIARALRPGGRAAVIVYSTPERNGFFSAPVSVIRRHAGLGPPAPGLPGPFSLSTPEAIGELFESAGLREIEVEALEAPVRLDSATECLRFERESFGALHQMLAELDAPAREAAWDEVAHELEQFETDKGFLGPCELLIAAGTRAAKA